MRTDVKVGLIALIIVILGVVGYFTWQNQRGMPATNETQLTGNHSSLETSDHYESPYTPSAPSAPRRNDLIGGPGSVVIAPPLQGSAATTQSLGGPTLEFPPPSPEPTTMRGPGEAMPPGFGNLGGTETAATFETSGSGKPLEMGHGLPGDVLMPPTGAATTQAELIPAPGSASSGGYTVVKGDTFTVIAKKLGTTITALEKANPSVSSNRLSIGQKLNVPAGVGTSTVSSSPSSSPPSSASSGGSKTVAKPTERRTDPPSSRTETRSEKRPAVYVVKKGDTLRSIAQRFYGDADVSQRIYRANRDVLGREPNNLKVGMELRLPE